MTIELNRTQHATTISHALRNKPVTWTDKVNWFQASGPFNDSEYCVSFYCKRVHLFKFCPDDFFTATKEMVRALEIEQLAELNAFCADLVKERVTRRERSQ